MDYLEAEKLIFDQLPSFQKSGNSALKYNLDNIHALCAYLGNPQDKLKCIHLAGTNGKGSCSHLIASILQEHGSKVGLYTSPHLRSYRERFRINGQEITEAEVLAFVLLIKPTISVIKPTFFEVSVALAFYWFEKSQVDFAVIEVGLGGRLDSTNIITPILSIITSIGLDHQKILGNTRDLIAKEKAGIIKHQVPVVIGINDAETAPVFLKVAEQNNAPIVFADDILYSGVSFENSFVHFTAISAGNTYEIKSPLAGKYQISNILTVIRSIEVLNQHLTIAISTHEIEAGITGVLTNTNFKGRWQLLNKAPLIICDTGHNKDAWEYLSTQISDINVSGIKYAILGFSNDKDIEPILNLIPDEIHLIFTEFESDRSLKIDEARLISSRFTHFYKRVNNALEDVLSYAKVDDFIFVGGSTYVIAELDNL